jgi:hypothetical protein
MKSWAFLLKVGSKKGNQGVEANIKMLQGLHKFAEKNRKPETVNGYALYLTEQVEM